MGSPCDELIKTVEWINANAAEHKIKFVVVTGDLTDSAERSEFACAKYILDKLTVPYVPLIGNHDIWPYINDENESNGPNGDEYFKYAFDPVLDSLATKLPEWDDGTRNSKVYNPEITNKDGTEAFSIFQNYAFSYGSYHFICADFVSRKHAVLGRPGALPGADLHYFEGGTWPWFMSHWNSYQWKHYDNMIVLTHYPTPNPRLLAPGIYSFAVGEYDSVARFLNGDKNHSGAWFAGHVHNPIRWTSHYTYRVKNVPGTSTICLGVVTDACKETGNRKDCRVVRMWDKTDAPDPNGIIVYWDADYLGKAEFWPEGSYCDSLSPHWVGNDQISSLRVKGSISNWLLYEHDDFGGRCLGCLVPPGTPDVPHLSYYKMGWQNTWNDEASSLKVLPPEKADLVASGIKFYKPGYPETPENEVSHLIAGELVTCKAILTNRGGLDTGDFNVKWYMDGQEVGYGGHTNLAPNETSEDNVRFDWTPTQGRHTVRFDADVDDQVAESNEDNNSTQRTVYVWATRETDLEDLAESFRKFRPTEAPQGTVTPIEIETVLRNKGYEKLERDFTVKFYASEDTDIDDASDYCLGETIVNPDDFFLRYVRITFSGEIPDNVPTGEYYVGWIIDFYDDIAESDETNNIAYKEGYKLTIFETNPIGHVDLRDGGPEYHDILRPHAYPGDDVAFNFHIHNDGNIPSGPFVIHVYASLDRTFDPAGDFFIAEGRIDSIRPQDYVAFTGTKSPVGIIPYGMQDLDDDAVYNIYWIIDPLDQVKETYEDNNLVECGNGEQITVPHPIGDPPTLHDVFDLIDAGEEFRGFENEADGTRIAQNGDTIDVSCKIRNAGNLPSGTYNVMFYAHNSYYIHGGADEVFLGSKQMTSAGICSFSFNIVTDPDEPGYNLDAGYKYYIGWVIQAEQGESVANNKATKMGYTLFVTVSKDINGNDSVIDLVDEGYQCYSTVGDNELRTLVPQEVYPGESTVVHTIIRNRGNANIDNSFVMNFYASADTTIDHNDHLLGSLAIPSLGGGDALTAIIEGNTTALTPGDYYVGWIIDERYESGNWVSDIAESSYYDYHDLDNPRLVNGEDNNITRIITVPATKLTIVSGQIS